MTRPLEPRPFGGAGVGRRPHGRARFGAAAWAAEAVALARSGPPDGFEQEVRWQAGRMTSAVRLALRRLPLLGEDRAGPLGPGLLTRGARGVTIRALQAGLQHSGAGRFDPAGG